jgi:glycosyltransferase involved in cell wall biosynthesis
VLAEDARSGRAELNCPRPISVLLLVYELDVGGNERDLSLLARNLDPQRYRVHAAAFRANGARRAELDAARIPVIELPVRSFLNRTAWGGARVLRDYAREHEIALIHAFDAPTSIFASVCGRLFGIPIISNHCYFRPLIPPPNRYALPVVDRMVRRIVVNSEAVKRHLIRDCSVPEKRIFVSHNGFDPGVFYPGTAPRGEDLVIGSLCVFREEKRIDVLIEAFATLPWREMRLCLLIVGGGPMLGPWSARAAELGLGNACRFEKASGNVADWLRAMDIFVLPSRSEGFPNALLEAMACGCAVIGSRVGGVPEMIEDGISGLLFSPSDAEDLRAKLAGLVENPARRRELATNAAESVRRRFLIASAAQRIESLYDSVLGEA